MLPPFAAAKSRQTRAIFLAAASESWFASKTLAAAFGLMTNSAGSDDFGGALGANRGTSALPRAGFWRGGRSSTSGGTDVPIT